MRDLVPLEQTKCKVEQTSWLIPYTVHYLIRGTASSQQSLEHSTSVSRKPSAWPRSYPRRRDASLSSHTQVLSARYVALHVPYGKRVSQALSVGGGASWLRVCVSEVRVLDVDCWSPSGTSIVLCRNLPYLARRRCLRVSVSSIHPVPPIHPLINPRPPGDHLKRAAYFRGTLGNHEGFSHPS